MQIAARALAVSLWTAEQATEYFESGGTVEPGKGPPPPPPAPKMPRVSDEVFKLNFPRWKPRDTPPKFRMVCFHNSGSAESVWSGKGLRQTVDNPYVLHCNENDGELLAYEMPGREQRRKEKRFVGPHGLKECAEALFPILAPVLQEDVPYVMIGHSMGTWLLYEWLKLLCAKGIPMPKQLAVSSFPHPALPERDRPWIPGHTLGEAAFKTEARTWSINEVVFADGNWKTYGPMIKDDFSLFDTYAYEPPPPHLPDGKFDVPIQAYFAKEDHKVVEAHMKPWADFTSSSFVLERVEGNHLFLYDFPTRAEYMKTVISRLPAGFR